MNLKIIGKFISKILFLEALFFVPAAGICLFDGDFKEAEAFGLSICVTLAIGALLALICKKAGKAFYAKEGFVSVALSWIVMSLLGCLPFIFSGAIPDFLDAFFEVVSGFTTTGATVIGDVESLSRGLIYWRSFTNWIGGMGVLVFMLAVVPQGNEGGFTMHLLRAESPGPSVNKLVPRMRKTAMILYMVYLALTFIDFILLYCGGFGLFESVCTAVETAGTGGFGINNDSLASCSPYIQIVTTVFMMLFGVNFTCFYLILLGHFKAVFKDLELKTYLGVYIGSVIAMSVNLVNYYESIGEAIRHSAFQAAAMITTAGFTTADFNDWPAFSKGLLVCLMLIGACAGSTGGGFKYARLILILKSLKRNIQKMLHPQRVMVVRVNGNRISENVLANVNAYTTAYMAILLVSFLIVSVNGFSFTTNLTAVISCFNNIGHGLDMIGPAGNFSAFSALSKIVLIIDMLAGRLEIYPILILFMRRTWVKE